LFSIIKKNLSYLLNYYIPQDEQLPDEHVLQGLEPAEDFKVGASPPEDAPLLTNPHADISLETSVEPHLGHSGVSPDMTRVSKFILHFLQ
jgi:hypothetical protein